MPEWSYLGFGFGLTVCSLLFALYWFQDRLLYYPSMPPGSRTQFFDPRELNLVHEEVFFPSLDGTRLQAWFFPHSRASPTMLYFHGNAGNISHRLLRVAQFREHLKCNVLILAYRGYGLSEGTPSQAGIQMDAQAALDLLRSRPDVDPNRVFVYGESLGGAVAIHLAAQNVDKLRAVVVENTFLSVTDMVDVVFPALSRVKFLCASPWRSVDVVHRLTCPMLYLSGDMDELVPPRHMHELFERATGSKSKRLHRFERGTHNDTWTRSGYYEAVVAFLREHNLLGED